MRKSNGQVEPIAAYLSQVASPALAQPQCRAWRLAKIWQTVVGASLASHTEPARLSQGVLTIRVDSPIWMHQLTFLRQDLLEKLQELWSEESIHDIRLQRGKLQKDQTPGERPVTSRLRPNAQECRQAKELAAVILDDRLRQAVERFLENQMARHRTHGEEKPQNITS